METETLLPIPGSGGGGPAGSSRGCFRCTPYQPAARCSDPMPMSEKSIVLGQGRGRREPQLRRGEGGRRPALDLHTPPLPHGSPGWTTWWGVEETRCPWGPLLYTENRDTCGGGMELLATCGHVRLCTPPHQRTHMWTRAHRSVQCHTGQHATVPLCTLQPAGAPVPLSHRSPELEVPGKTGDPGLSRRGLMEAPRARQVLAAGGAPALGPGLSMLLEQAAQLEALPG